MSGQLKNERQGPDHDHPKHVPRQVVVPLEGRFLAQLLLLAQLVLYVRAHTQAGKTRSSQVNPCGAGADDQSIDRSRPSFIPIANRPRTLADPRPIQARPPPPTHPPTTHLDLVDVLGPAFGAERLLVLLLLSRVPRLLPARARPHLCRLALGGLWLCMHRGRRMMSASGMSWMGDIHRTTSKQQ